MLCKVLRVAGPAAAHVVRICRLWPRGRPAWGKDHPGTVSSAGNLTLDLCAGRAAGLFRNVRTKLAARLFPGGLVLLNHLGGHPAAFLDVDALGLGPPADLARVEHVSAAVAPGTAPCRAAGLAGMGDVPGEQLVQFLVVRLGIRPLDQGVQVVLIWGEQGADAVCAHIRNDHIANLVVDVAEEAVRLHLLGLVTVVVGRADVMD
jgi:hypothetical protein